MKDDLVLSTMAKTCFFDLDGTIVKNTGYKTDGKDTLLSGAKQYLEGLPDCDRVVLVTSRTEEYREETLRFLKENHIRYDEILFNLPMGERIIVNDRKPSGLDIAVALNMERDQFNLPNIVRQK